MSTQTTFLDDRAAPAEPPARPQEYLVPVGGRVVTCRSCGAQMIWARTARNQAMPLSVASIVERGGKPYAVPHWIDCPTRNQHRRSK